MSQAQSRKPCRSRHRRAEAALWYANAGRTRGARSIPMRWRNFAPSESGASTATELREKRKDRESWWLVPVDLLAHRLRAVTGWEGSSSWSLRCQCRGCFRLVLALLEQQVTWVVREVGRVEMSPIEQKGDGH